MYAGLREGSFTLKMSLRKSIPSYVTLSDFRIQVYVYVTYAGQRRTCRLCGAFDHMAAMCPRRSTPEKYGEGKGVGKEREVTTQSTGEHLQDHRTWSKIVEDNPEECVTLPEVSQVIENMRMEDEVRRVELGSQVTATIDTVIQEFLGNQNEDGTLSMVSDGKLIGEEGIQEVVMWVMGICNQRGLVRLWLKYTTLECEMRECT
nr:uncharacterized protein LOC128685623 [Cherax quadricarinatus]